MNELVLAMKRRKKLLAIFTLIAAVLVAFAFYQSIRAYQQYVQGLAKDNPKLPVDHLSYLLWLFMYAPQLILFLGISVVVISAAALGKLVLKRR